MKGFKHHGFSVEEMRNANWDTTSLVQARFDAAMAAPPDSRTWNVKNKRWGGIWFTVNTTGPYTVVAGLEGEMTGIVVASFDSVKNVANLDAYGEQFFDGSVFALQNGDVWQAYVREANAQRSFDTATLQGLLNRGRGSGLTVEGRTVTVEDLRKRFSD